jgi:hypothetical protein
VVVQVEKRGQSLTPHYQTPLDTRAFLWYAVGMMKVGELVQFCAEDDKFHGKKGIIVRCVESNIYQQGRHYELQTLDGHVILALDFELERLENDVE